MSSRKRTMMVPPTIADTTQRSLRGVFYPRRITNTLSALKIACGCGLVIFGALALYQKASYARTASGVWAGIVIIISGVLGCFSVRTNASRPYVWSFFASCALAIIASVLVIIYSATGLARDSGFPGGFVRDAQTGDLIPVEQANLPAREGAMLINLALILLGVLDVLFTLPCCIICLRELCHCYSGSEGAGGSSLGLLGAPDSGGGSYIDDRSEWLMSWLGQQHPAAQQQVFFSQASGLPHPYSKMSPYHMVSRNTPPFVLLQPTSEPSQSSAGQSPAGRNSRHRSSSSSHARQQGQQQRPRSKSPRQVSSERRQ